MNYIIAHICVICDIRTQIHTGKNKCIICNCCFCDKHIDEIKKNNNQCPNCWISNEKKNQ